MRSGIVPTGDLLFGRYKGRKEVTIMSDYEMISVMLTFIGLLFVAYQLGKKK